MAKDRAPLARFQREAEVLARGKRVDKRADIWAFGVVLFEMLRGQRVFKGERG